MHFDVGFCCSPGHCCRHSACQADAATHTGNGSTWGSDTQRDSSDRVLHALTPPFAAIAAGAAGTAHARLSSADTHAVCSRGSLLPSSSASRSSTPPPAATPSAKLGSAAAAAAATAAAAAAAALSIGRRGVTGMSSGGRVAPASAASASAASSRAWHVTGVPWVVPQISIISQG